MENWKAVTGSDGLYLISDTGNVKSYKNGEPHILRPRINSDGYIWYIL